MLKSIFNAITSLVELIFSLAEFLIDFVFDLLMIGKLLQTVPTDLVNWTSWLPSVVVSMFTISITVAILYKVAGRT